MVRRGTPPNVDLPAPLAERVDAALAQISEAAFRARGLPDTAAGAVDRLDAMRGLGETLDVVAGILLAWCVEDAQVSQALLAETVGIDRSGVARRAHRYLPGLRALG